MFGSIILDVAIGLLFTYLVFSLAGTVVTEWIAGILKLRSKTLESGIRQLLSDPKAKPQATADKSAIAASNPSGLADDLYQHPLIKALFTQKVPLPIISRGKTLSLNRPSYIPSGTFTLALLDNLTSANNGTMQSVKDVRDAVDHLPDSEPKKALQAVLSASGDLPAVRKNIEDWFDAAMDRVSGFYKRQAQLVSLTVAVVIALSLNVDSVMIGNQLFHDEALRNSIVAAAQQVTTGSTAASSETLQLEKELATAPIPVGWSTSGGPQGAPTSPGGWLLKLAGLILTTIAISFGAPFWFDLLKRVMNIRSSGPEPKPDQMSATATA